MPKIAFALLFSFGQSFLSIFVQFSHMFYRWLENKFILETQIRSKIERNCQTKILMSSSADSSLTVQKSEPPRTRPSSTSGSWRPRSLSSPRCSQLGPRKANRCARRRLLGRAGEAPRPPLVGWTTTSYWWVIVAVLNGFCYTQVVP